MEKYFEMLSWWQMPLSALGTLFLSFLSEVLTLMIVLGIILYILKRL